jgi:hypothetical protein
VRRLAALAAAAAWSSLALSSAPSSAPERRTLRLRYTPADREVGRYQYVPVTIGADTTRLEIAYRYDKRGGANAVDLGLLEPGPLALGTPARRGWSGGARDRVIVADTEATPGYWPGPLPAGEWHVALGLYKVASAGVDVELQIETSRGARGPTPALASRPAEPIRRGEAWYAGDLHVHTWHSDGSESAAAAARAAREAGLDFIAITDHNNTTHQLEPLDAPGLLVIGGEEVTTPGGHANVWGLRGWRSEIDFRVPPGPGSIEPLVVAATARGALFSINHPVLECGGCSWEHEIPAGIASMEVWNGPSAQPAAVAWWERLLREGRRVTAVGASDWHRAPAVLGRASVRVRADELSAPAILAAIRAGRVVVMGDARTPPPVLTVRSGTATAAVGDTLRVHPGDALEVEVAATDAAFTGGRAHLVGDGEAAGDAPLSPDAPARFRRTATANSTLRAEVLAPDGSLLALTNPVYVVTEDRAPARSSNRLK